MEKVSIYKLAKLASVKPGGFTEARRINFPAGEMAQIINGHIFVYLAYIEFQYNENSANFPRGNHFHENKSEYIYVAKGHLRGLFYDLNTGEYGTSDIESGDLIHILPQCVHSFLPLEYTVAIEFTNVEYDSSDTYPYVLEQDKPYVQLIKKDGFIFKHKGECENADKT